MNTENAVAAMSALAHAHRMEIFRILVKEGPTGLAAGEISARLEISPSTLSFHVTQLERAGLVQSRRESRHIFYAVDVDGMRGLLKFLTEDCCNGEPELCGDLLRVANFGLSTGASRDERR